MQAIRDIFTAFGTVSRLADALGKKYDTVLAWRTRGRIPEDAWTEVIAAARKIGLNITAAQLFEFNAPMKKRGKPPSKVKAIRAKRPESRVA